MAGHRLDLTITAGREKAILEMDLKLDDLLEKVWKPNAYLLL